MTTLVQVALCTADMPRSIRTFVEVLGFDSAGGRPRWGAHGGRLQELPSGDQTAAMIWWLIGRQEFGGQIELFHHTGPRQRPLRSDWSPADIGWSRFGVLVPDFDAVYQRLQEADLEILTEPLDADRLRRVCFREPWSAAIVEVVEEGSTLPSAQTDTADRRPAVLYVTASVSDLDASRRQIAESFGLAELPSDTLHRPEHEALWGLPGAQSRSAVFDGSGILLELVQYDEPTPRPPSEDALLSDQGLMNVALGYRDAPALASAVADAEATGAPKSVDTPTVSGSTYLRLRDQLSVEMLLVPPGQDEHFGYVPQPLAPAGNLFAVPRDGEASN